MKELKILGLTQTNSGSRYHRVYLGLKYLNNKVIQKDGEDYKIVTTILECSVGEYAVSEDIVKNYDILYLNWITSISPVQLSLWKKKYGLKIISDQDDSWKLPENHLQKSINFDSIVPQIVVSDACVVSTLSLANKVLEFNDYVSYNPNMLPDDGQFKYTPREAKTGPIALTLSGGIAHMQDWLSLRNIIKKINDDSDIQNKVYWKICGYTKGKEWDSIVSMVSSNPKMKVEIVESKNVDSYMEIYEGVDILLCPLLPSEFTIMKSALKLNEASRKDIAVIGSPLFLDKELNNLLVAEKASDWYKHIKYLIKDNNYIKIGREQGEKNRDLNDFEGRIENLRLLVEYISNNETEKAPDKLKIYSIKYDESQTGEYEEILNKPTSNLQRFEYGVMLNKLEEIKSLNYKTWIGFFSWKFPLKTMIPKKVLYKVFSMVDKENTDLINFTRNYWQSSSHFLEFSNNYHPHLKDLLKKVCDHINIPYSEEGQFVTYSNFFLMKQRHWIDYLENCVIPAIKYMEEELSSEVDIDANYTGGLNKEDLKKYTGLDYYNYCTFILERMIIQWANFKQYKIQNAF